MLDEAHADIFSPGCLKREMAKACEHNSIRVAARGAAIRLGDIMRESERLLLSPEEMDRHLKAAKQIRARTLRAASAAARDRLTPQQLRVKLAQVSALALGAGLAVFATTLIAAPRTTVAAITSPGGIDPEEITRRVGGDLPSFADHYQAYIGVLDTLDKR